MPSNNPSSKVYLEGKKLNKIEQQKAEKDGLDIGSELDHFAKIGWEKMDKTDLELRLKWYGMFWRPKTPGKFMMRLRIPNGILNAQQTRVIATIVERYGDSGSCDITTRQNLQLRGVLINDLPNIIQQLKSVGLHTLQSGFDNPRNVTGNPLAGIDPKEIIDTRPFTIELQDFLTNKGEGNHEFSNLPRKWNTAVAGAKDNFLLHNDIVFHPVENNGTLGFGVWIGGILSPQMNSYAVPLNAWIPQEDICRMTDCVIRVWRDNGERNVRTKGRFRFYMEAIGLENVRQQIEEMYGPLTPDPGSIFNEQPRIHYGIHEQKQKDLYYVGLHVPVGRLTAEDLHDLATAASTYGDGELRLTEDQNLILANIKQEHLDNLKKDPLLKRFPRDPGTVASGTVSCTGSAYCSFAMVNTKDRARTIAEELDQELHLPEEVKIHWTGCPNTCGQAFMGAIGLTGKKAKNSEGVTGEGFQITVGGSQGPDPSVGDIYMKTVPAEEVKSVIKDLLIERFGATSKR
ncbi:ferredoxin--nitrite reductase [Synechococcus sp. KORDI-100]|uniref:ferredoxin--nitrite reductase n=1 Tax=Synechococcus sp. KORDI-100 TaxID=1280380 RepID=UPI00056F21C2|nr:ferredoxin--nitrite reductase [Synechococcus sp. KORDI-100]